MIRGNVILAVTKRNFRSYFSGVLGYLFVIVFCVVCARIAFNELFFAANQANLEQLNQWFPYLLLTLVPAITMTCWAEEKKLGTDELLFTLPATDTEVLLGKYLAVLSVYTVAVLFSIVNVMILEWLGDPDGRTLASTYFGYWLAGAALLSIGMLASALTSNATVAFVLGSVFCSVPVFIGRTTDALEWFLQLFGIKWNLYQMQTALEAVSVPGQLRDFTLGVVSLSGVCYFVLLTILMLYLNLVVISKRRWHASRTVTMGGQFAVRAICLAVTFVSLLLVTTLFPARADMTLERLFSLSDSTKEALDSLDAKNPITIQAFVSPEVPRDYSETRRRLLGLLHEYDLRGGGALEVRVVDVEPYSNEAEEARGLGINPVRIQYQEEGRTEDSDVFLGAVVQSTTDNVLIPFFGKGLPIEYELTRSVQTVAQDKRLTIGVLQTDAGVMAEPDSGGRDWEIVAELKKQYDVKFVNPLRRIVVDKPEGEDADSAADDEDDAEKPPAEGFDVLLAVMPSTLTQPEMDNFMEYVQSGKPVLIFDDPFPTFNTQLCPKLPKPSPGGMFMQQSRPEQKADNGELTTLMRLLDVKWDSGQIAFDASNPFSELSYLPPTFLFVSNSEERDRSFNEDSPITSQLQNVVEIYGGTLQERDRKKDQDFIPLLLTNGKTSGLLAWDEYVDMQFNFMSGGQVARPKEISNYARYEDDFAHVLAAHITNDGDETPLNVVFCGDADMIGDQFFVLRNRQFIDIEFDNVTFVLNAVDVLAGHEGLIDLRSRRAGLRTLTEVERQTRGLRNQLAKEEKDANNAMEDRLKEAREELEKEIEELQERTDLDARARDQLIRQKEENLNRQLDLDREELEAEMNNRVRKVAIDTRQKIRRVESQIGIVAYVLPAVLPLCFGMLFLGLRNLAEQQSITPDRRRR
ncbi:MAG: Gldg family protein [Planctomycetaceae bacterium]